jgi:hypothetical protein
VGTVPNRKSFYILFKKKKNLSLMEFHKLFFSIFSYVLEFHRTLDIRSFYFVQ